MQIVTRPEEILIRFAQAGGIQGAHVKYRQLAVSDNGDPILNPDGSALMDVVGMPTVLAAGGEEMGAIVGQALVDMTAELWAVQIDLTAATAQVNLLTTQNTALIRANKALQAQVKALTPPAPEPTA
jgi:hypothetical protein